MKLWAAWLMLLWSCGRPHDTVQLRVRGLGDQRLDAAALRYQPASNVLSARLSTSGTLSIERRDTTAALTVLAPGLCPVTIPAGVQTAPATLQPVIDLGPDRPPLGFAARFTLDARHHCPEQGLGRISWRQIEGAPLSELVVSNTGFQLSASMPSFAQLHPEPPPAGLIPISPRTQGRVVLEASWSGGELPPLQRRVVLTASSRATGVSSVSVSQQLLLSSPGWHVAQAPQGGHARVHDADSLSVFTPDAPGRWGLSSAAGDSLTLQASWHDKTPYDCGRSECHRELSESAAKSPMSHALERQLTAAKPAAVGCMLDCHVLGERGLEDGGFLAVARELGWTWLDATRWDDLPQPLRRLGGVRCTACHGPSAIPEPEAREQILRSDVCATCHDAPPSYVHVTQWRSSRMARSDDPVATRLAPCARCHTTAGFLASTGARAGREPKFAAAATGIACAACHAPHASHSGPRLLRAVPTNDDLPPSAALCVSCHAPGPDELQPSASSAVLWSGRAQLPSVSTDGLELVTGAAPHRAVAGGCVGCHGASVPPTAALDHSFRVAASVCVTCHDAAHTQQLSAAVSDVQRRASALASRLEQTCRVEPHASTKLAPCPSRALTRARYELGLVLSDPAAGVHNAAFARTLLADAERLLAD